MTADHRDRTQPLPVVGRHRRPPGVGAAVRRDRMILAVGGAAALLAVGGFAAAVAPKGHASHPVPTFPAVVSTAPVPSRLSLGLPVVPTPELTLSSTPVATSGAGRHPQRTAVSRRSVPMPLPSTSTSASPTTAALPSSETAPAPPPDQPQPDPSTEPVVCVPPQVLDALGLACVDPSPSPSPSASDTASPSSQETASDTPTSASNTP